jgi:hypothetical protein
MASCGDDDTQACVPQETRLCAGIGRCQGVEACLSDGSGFGPCDCSGPPREGNGGTSGEDPLLSLVGRACTEDAQCGAGLTCFTSASNQFLGGGPGNGYCSLPCTQDAECAAVDQAAECVVTAEGASGFCFRTCLSLDPRSLAENKCLGRRDVVCQSEAYLELATFSSLRQDGWCLPQCGSDDDCAGRRCDLARGLCVDEAGLTPGKAIGERCEDDGECAGRLCIGLGGGESFCSAPCVFGQPTGCGYGLAASARAAACIAPQIQGFLNSEGLGDVGFCAELCADDTECAQAASRGWTCEESDQIETLFNRPGLCDGPDLGDGGVDGGAAVDASTVDASGGDAG